MKWKHDAIYAWRDWIAFELNHSSIVPPYQQVGKILEFTLCDEASAEDFISQQMHEDKRNPYGVFLDGGYWTSVKTMLITLQVNNIMMMVEE